MGCKCCATLVFLAADVNRILRMHMLCHASAGVGQIFQKSKPKPQNQNHLSNSVCYIYPHGTSFLRFVAFDNAVVLSS